MLAFLSVLTDLPSVQTQLSGLQAPNFSLLSQLGLIERGGPQGEYGQNSGVARGLLQGRPLQFPMGWGVGEELTKSWPTFEQLYVQNLALAIRTAFLLLRARTKSGWLELRS